MRYLLSLAAVLFTSIAFAQDAGFTVQPTKAPVLVSFAPTSIRFKKESTLEINQQTAWRVTDGALENCIQLL